MPRPPLLLLLLLFCNALHAGENAAVEVGVAPQSDPCDLRAGERIEFFVAARNMVQVRQIKFDLSWQPPAAFTTVEGRAAGAAEFFIVPGPAQVEGNRAEFGMATFGEGLDGEGILAHFTAELADGLTGETPVEIRVEQLSLGPSSSERDLIRPLQAVILGNYCDSFGQPVARGLFIRPRQQRSFFSASSRGRIADGSRGEVLLDARFLEEGRFLPEYTLTWTIDNRGTAPVYILATSGVIAVAPGADYQGNSLSDRRGETFLLLDAEPGPDLSPSSVELTVCGEREGERYCTASRILWNADATAVAATATLPARSALHPNYPNPFNAGTTIPFTLAGEEPREVRLEIFDLAGQLVTRLFAGSLPAGSHALTWDGRDRSGRSLTSGLYLCRLRTHAETQVRSLLLVR